MKLQRVEDLECWREARVLVNMIFKKSSGRTFKKDTQLRNHVTGASLDVMNTITEGYEAHADAEFVRQLRYAMRSISEVQTTLYAALDLKYISKDDFMQLYDQMQKTRKLIDGFRQYLSGRQSGGGRHGRRWRGPRRDRGRQGGGRDSGQRQGGGQQGGGQQGGGQQGGGQQGGGPSQQPSGAGSEGHQR